MSFSFSIRCSPNRDTGLSKRLLLQRHSHRSLFLLMTYRGSLTLYPRLSLPKTFQSRNRLILFPIRNVEETEKKKKPPEISFVWPMVANPVEKSGVCEPDTNQCEPPCHISCMIFRFNLQCFMPDCTRTSTEYRDRL